MPEPVSAGYQPSDPSDPRRKRNARLALILTSVIFGLLLIPGIGAVMISPMVFDAPDAGKNPRLVAFTASLVAYPFLTAASILASWVLYALKRYRAAVQVSLLPLLALLAALICFILVETAPRPPGPSALLPSPRSGLIRSFEIVRQLTINR